MAAIDAAPRAGSVVAQAGTQKQPDVGTALVALASWLRQQGYVFVPPTPETHRRNNERQLRAHAHSLRDAFGWSWPFDAGLLPGELLATLQGAGLVADNGDGRWRSSVRIATLGVDLYAHSAYPTIAADSVFFGPDTYRFVRFIEQATRDFSPMTGPGRTIVDIGCGSGAGGIAAWRLLGMRDRVVLADINERALELAAANARLAQVDDVTCLRSDVFAGIAGDADLIVSNPPYMFDPDARVYRHGGALHGCELSLRIVRESLERLRPGGCLALYTGAAVVDGRDVFRDAVTPLLDASGLEYRYEEIDPDVFGEELESPHYADVERIAAVGLTVNRLPASGSSH